MKRTATAFVVLALVLTACQSVSENIAESITEKAIDSIDGVDSVDIDADSGQISFEADGETITIGGGEIPDGFPIPVPDGYKVTAVQTADDVASVSLMYPSGDLDEIVGFFADWVNDQPAAWEKSTTSMTDDDGSIEMVGWSSPDDGSYINVTNTCFGIDGDTDSEDCVAVTILSASP